MFKTLCVSSLLFMLLLLLLSLKSPRAEMTEHHGFMVTVEETTSGCLVCHDGTSAKSVASCSGVDCRLYGSHGVNMPYPPEGKEDQYKPVERLTAARIKLINDQVSCISCHDLNNHVGAHLVMDNAGSSLCFGCHNK
ncbi:cytochrome c3 family protein [Geotalea sp. SG265]|uniref:cytochrome c3 family protein n=1 Tax=Geotalea sp. SG265 TaxID=2922867 RepID=UPI001FAF0626|nr:cytochrome c3 family protein [Geotalea sp. SG265]